MFPHLKERLILTDKLNTKGKVADNVAVINATDLSPMIENTCVKEIREVVVPDAKNKPVEISLKVAELSTTTAIETMIASGQCQMSVNGVVVQNGMATTQVNNKTATGEEVPQNIVITTRQQYGLPEDAVVYCNFNQLYKIDPLTLHMWAHVSLLISPFSSRLIPLKFQHILIHVCNECTISDSKTRAKLCAVVVALPSCWRAKFTSNCSTVRFNSW